MSDYFPEHLRSDDESRQRWTEQTDLEAAQLFDTLSDKEIRSRQGITRDQIKIAFEKKNDCALLDLQRQDDALWRAMMRRLRGPTPADRRERA